MSCNDIPQIAKLVTKTHLQTLPPTQQPTVSFSWGAHAVGWHTLCGTMEEWWETRGGAKEFWWFSFCFPIPIQSMRLVYLPRWKPWFSWQMSIGKYTIPMHANGMNNRQSRPWNVSVVLSLQNLRKINSLGQWCFENGLVETSASCTWNTFFWLVVSNIFFIYVHPHHLPNISARGGWVRTTLVHPQTSLRKWSVRVEELGWWETSASLKLRIFFFFNTSAVSQLLIYPDSFQ